MNIIYISYDGMTDPLGQSQVIPYLIGLTQKGHHISIISCEKKDKFKKHKVLIQNILVASNISWHPVPYSSMPSFLSKQLNLFLIKQKTKELFKIKIPDAIHCRSYMASLIGLDFKRKYGIKFIFDMRGFWADERIDGGIWDKKNQFHKRIYNYFKKKEIEFLTQADYTISLTQNAKKEILSWHQFSVNPIPIQVIPCCADLKLFNYENIIVSEQEKLKKQLIYTLQISLFLI